MKVRIKQSAANKDLWYSGLIGKCFIVFTHQTNNWLFVSSHLMLLPQDVDVVSEDTQPEMLPSFITGIS